MAQSGAQATTDEAHGVVVQADGKIVVAGRTLNALATGSWAFGVARYNANGSLDSSFGRGGKVATGFDRNGAEAYAVALQPDGKIVAAGRVFTRPADGEPAFALARYGTDGRLDGSFGNGGLVTTPIGRSATAHAVTVLADGRIIVAGVSSGGSNTDFTVVAYREDGSVDDGFGGGVTVMDLSGSDDAARALAVDSEGRVIVAGHAGSGRSTGFAVVRFNADGSLDESFGGGAVVTILDRTRDSEAHAVGVMPDGTIVAAGFSNDGFGKRLALARYQQNGDLDRRFAGVGAVSMSTCSGCFNDVVQGLAVQADGGIVVGGQSARSDGFSAVLARFTPAGALDSGFGNGGLVITRVGSGRNTWVNALALDGDGGIVAAGEASPSDPGDYLVMRLDASGGADGGFGQNGIVVTQFGDLRP